MIKISDYSSKAPKGVDKDAIKKETQRLVNKLGHLQNFMYAQKKHSLLVILQGMDGSGKDGAIQNVFHTCAPGGLSVTYFKKPSEEEFAHDFLWRIHKVAPPKGMIHIFNRSQYEDVLIQRVHAWIDEERVKKRFAAINAFEELLEFDNNTKVVKFFLHISKEEQEKQLQQRIDDPLKNWKHNAGDWEERKLWDNYMNAYQDVLNKSSIPWHICPVDNRWYRDYFIAKTLVEIMEKMDIEIPTIDGKSIDIDKFDFEKED